MGREAKTMDPEAADVHQGGCLCGAIRFSLRGPALQASLCHCTDCRRQTGAPVAAFVRYATGNLRLDRGSPAVYRASADAIRNFCANCGSALFWRQDGGPNVSVFLGALDQPDAMPVPIRQLFADDAIGWMPDLPGEVFAQNG